MLTLDAPLEGGVCGWTVSGICRGMCVIQCVGGWSDWKWDEDWVSGVLLPTCVCRASLLFLLGLQVYFGAGRADRDYSYNEYWLKMGSVPDISLCTSSMQWGMKQGPGPHGDIVWGSSSPPPPPVL